MPMHNPYSPNDRDPNDYPERCYMPAPEENEIFFTAINPDNVEEENRINIVINHEDKTFKVNNLHPPLRSGRMPET